MVKFEAGKVYYIHCECGYGCDYSAWNVEVMITRRTDKSVWIVVDGKSKLKRVKSMTLNGDVVEYFDYNGFTVWAKNTVKIEEYYFGKVKK